MDLSILIQPSRWCAPVVIYALISVASVILILSMVGGMEPIMPVSGMSKWAAGAVWLLLFIAMMYLMLYLCQVNLQWVAWVILALPILVALWQQYKQ